MADFNSSLPVRTENNGDVAVFLVDGTTPSQKAAVDANGSVASLLKNAAGTAVDFNFGTVGAATLRIASQIGNATGAADFNFGAASAQTLRAAALIGNATGAADFNFGTVGAQTLRAAAQIGNATGVADFNYGAVSAQTLRTASQVGNATGAADFNNGATGAQTLRVAANLAVAGANVSNTNPVPVYVLGSPSNAVNDYKDATAIAAAASDNHDYAVTAGKTLHLNQVEGAASGKAKMVVQVETGVASNVFTTYWSKFNSTADTNFSIPIQNEILVAAGVRVRVIMTNLDKAAQDLYSTISGFEI